MVDKPSVAKTVKPIAVGRESQGKVLPVASHDPAECDCIPTNPVFDVTVGLDLALTSVPGARNDRSRLAQHDRALKAIIGVSENPCT
jgi:hypothetical protein